MYPELPLKGNACEAKYKLYYPYTGLLVSSLDDEAQEDLRVNENMGVYKGTLYENFVAEAFVKQGLGLYYFKKENFQLEVRVNWFQLRLSLIVISQNYFNL